MYFKQSSGSVRRQAAASADQSSSQRWNELIWGGLPRRPQPPPWCSPLRGVGRRRRPEDLRGDASLPAVPQRKTVEHRHTPSLLAPEVCLGKVDDLVAAAAENRLDHEHPEPVHLLETDRRWHGEL